VAIISHSPTTTHIPPKLAFTRYLVPIGRVFFVLIFLAAAPNHFAAAGIGYAAQQGVPAAGVLVPLSGVLALVGGLSVALGFYTRIGALLLAIFLIPVTLMMHKFWAFNDPMQHQMQLVMFLKNVSILGATFLLMYFGPGPFSVDRSRSRVLP
jgi:putative oxidoreductase